MIKCLHLYVNRRIIKTTKRAKKKGGKMMYETVKTVKGIAITRAKGTHGFYYVNIKEGKGWREFHTFRTIKAAAEFIEKTF